MIGINRGPFSPCWEISSWNQKNITDVTMPFYCVVLWDYIHCYVNEKNEAVFTLFMNPLNNRRNGKHTVFQVVARFMYTCM